MKLALLSDPTDFVQLEVSTFWMDEFSWSPSSSSSEYSLNGALIIDYAPDKLTGRPITLQPPDNEMAWVFRSDVRKLYEWTTIKGLKMRLTLEYPGDTRTFVVIWRPGESSVLDATPVMGFTNFNDGEYFRVTLKLIETEA